MGRLYFLDVYLRKSCGAKISYPCFGCSINSGFSASATLLNLILPFTGLILIGLASIFMAHIFINSAMASGLMPVKGLPLPFISYGGSFLVSSFMMIGMILNFGRDDGY